MTDPPLIVLSSSSFVIGSHDTPTSSATLFPRSPLNLYPLPTRLARFRTDWLWILIAPSREYCYSSLWNDLSGTCVPVNGCSVVLSTGRRNLRMARVSQTASPLSILTTVLITLQLAIATGRDLRSTRKCAPISREPSLGTMLDRLELQVSHLAVLRRPILLLRNGSCELPSSTCTTKV